MREVINFQDYVGKSAKYISPSTEGLALIASSIFPDATKVSDKKYKDAIPGVLDSGLNVGLYGSSFTAIYNWLAELGNKTKQSKNNAQESEDSTNTFSYNVPFNLLTSNPDLHNNIYLNYFLVRLKDFPNFGGWNFSDEPKYYDLKKIG